MPCHRISDGIVCEPTVTHGKTIAGKTVWRWEFREWGGPLFVREDGEPRVNQDPPKAVWDAFETWLAAHR